MIKGEAGRFSIDGAITMDNANAVLEDGLAKFGQEFGQEFGQKSGQKLGQKSGQALVVDLSALTEIDSAAVSLLLEWRRANPNLHFVGFSDNLKSLVTLYGVLDLVQ
jgi:phospholipid transport system transporter-binding protein